MSIADAVAQLEQAVAENPAGCTFCAVEPPADLDGWTARGLDADVVWRLPDGDQPAGVMPAADLYWLCPSCESWIAGQRPASYVDALLDLTGLTGAERGAVRAELLPFLLAVADRLGPPADLATTLMQGGGGDD
ncbi:hypothetical protein U2F26_13785 [Micromonospora sp. 4G57]|uniref:Uncharacterized protein n=1 Tax=Micromonospora sicca TaxID=2202420 RepID=A0ABU5JAR5_9ACTN|nr:MULTISPECIES: hypothetical protein [unclassified Micromonospora]MDZ5443795.1 hypothetical protein [Micromonospora sp. 4G57]MDZ5489687.1 hypothetical protein [Micromonospora sp. 4G53]